MLCPGSHGGDVVLDVLEDLEGTHQVVPAALGHDRGIPAQHGASPAGDPLHGDRGRTLIGLDP